MRMRLKFPVVGQTVGSTLRAELAFVPDGKLHGQRREESWLAATPAQTRARAESAVVRRQLEGALRGVIPLIGRVARDAADDSIERNLLTGIEQVINAQGQTPAVAREGFVGQVGALAHFRVIISETAAGHADSQVGLLADGVADAQF